jgi:hypothetical protein
LLEEGVKQMGIIDHRIALRAGERSRLLKSFSSFNGEPIWLDHDSPPKQSLCPLNMP